MVALTVPVGEAKAGETAPRRKSTQKAQALERPTDSKATTLVDFFEECVKRQGKRNAMGWRDFIDTHVETKKVTKKIDGKNTQVDKDWIYYEYAKYSYIHYPDLLQLIKDYSRGLVKLGLKPQQVDKLHIYAQTSHRWMQTFLAAQFQGIPAVTAYDTLGESGLVHSLLQTELKAIFTDNTLLPLLVRPLKEAKEVKFIIHFDDIDPNDKRMGGKYYSDAIGAKEKILENRPEIKFISFNECVELGRANRDIELKSPAPEDLSCIMYTSGSTGPPKGVVLSQGNILAGIAGVSTNADRSLVSNNDRIIAFLPLAHIFELTFELAAFWWGGCLGYANVKTLTDTSCRNCQSDLVEFKPHIMVGVAAVWESVRKGVLAKIRKESIFVQKIFWSAYHTKAAFKAYHIPGAGVFDVVFKKVKAATGGELRYVLNGGSPISKDAQVFVSNLIAPMLLGYGLTETCANTTIVEHKHFEYGTVGTLTGAVTAKLIDVPDAGYFAKNNQGEILLTGPCVTKEYYKNEKETADSFTPDGWFKTGDIGEWASNGALRIVDRKKNLVKTLNGEYIALEKLESVYRSNPVVFNLCAYADQSKVKPIAIVLPNEANLKSFLADEKIYSQLDLDSKELAHLCEEKKVINAVTKHLVQTGKSQGLKGIELIQTVVLLDDEWTPQNGFVTSAQKLQRKKILASCQDKVDEAYNDS
ncbi:unnamed protein product [Debaryomyces tyrocola]|nr:unnamed protein product [Debaryomyces tyrocola]